LTDPIIYTLALVSVPGIGPKRFRSLIARFGSAREAFLAPQRELAFWARSEPGLAGRIVDSRDSASVTLRIERLCEASREAGMDILCFESESYPPKLKEVPDSPPVLWLKGNLVPRAARVAVVGTRRATSYGRRVVKDLCRHLVLGHIEVVSGLATGIDGAAHEETVRLGGRTLAVLACGLDVSLGSDRDALKERILAAGGAVLSEYAPGTRPCGQQFPARNRIISGLSDAVVVVEAPSRSGALITAGFALEQGRDVLAVPGSIYSSTSEGCHQLIKDGAAPVTCGPDITRALGLLPAAQHGSTQQELAGAGSVEECAGDEARVFCALKAGESAFDAIVEHAGVDPVECARALGMLEIKGLARRLSDGSYEIVLS